MDIQVTAFGAVTGLIIATILIFIKTPPVYGLFIGALTGGLLGGASLAETIELMINGAQDMVTAILRILAAGILAGVLIETGAQNQLPERSLIKLVKQKHFLH